MNTFRAPFPRSLPARKNELVLFKFHEREERLFVRPWLPCFPQIRGAVDADVMHAIDFTMPVLMFMATNDSSRL